LSSFVVGLCCAIPSLAFVLTALVCDFLLVAMLVRLEPVRRRVDRYADELARRDLIAELAPEHRRELDQIDQVVQVVARTPGVDSTATHSLADTYLQVAVGCARSRRLLAAADSPARAYPGGGARTQVRRLRAECHHRAQADINRMERQLELVADTVYLIHEHTIAQACRQHAGLLVDDINQMAEDVARSAQLGTEARIEVDVACESLATDDEADEGSFLELIEQHRHG
jgi:hypothetical protein